MSAAIGSIECVSRDFAIEDGKVFETLRLSWTIPAFAKLPSNVGDAQHSPSIRDWHLRLHPAGEDEKNAGFVSLFIEAESPNCGVRASFQVVLPLRKPALVRDSITRHFDARSWGFHALVSLDEFLTKDVRGDGSAVIEAHLRIEREKVETGDKLKTAEMIGNLRVSGELSDVELRASSEGLRCHRAILAMQSPEFKVLQLWLSCNWCVHTAAAE